MRILLTNDDGIDAPGLKILETLAHELAGENGEVWVVAPSSERSGTGHCISFSKTFESVKVAPRKFKLEGYPADCVLAGLYRIMDQLPDLILVGVNRGNNSGENAMYSGTIGAAMEGSLQGLKSIALSQYMGLANKSLNNPFDASVQHGLTLVRQLYYNSPWDEKNYRLFFNVNFPPCSANQVRGVKVVRQGQREKSRFTARYVDSTPNGELLSIQGGLQTSRSSEGTDINANLDHYISVTPMRADLTDNELLGKIDIALVK
ncbi:MAG: 5'/3'-nucleotidase SurE [Rhodobacteraceae bacterium]|nr:5'/3'-nucleotidase SurE [Paracoccaceae bacterium]MCY4250923.1 5'/3'-nucleotidase SurE [Paracoccaceae bacterium]